MWRGGFGAWGALLKKKKKYIRPMLTSFPINYDNPSQSSYNNVDVDIPMT